MISTIAIHGYRSLRDLVMPLGRVTVVTGANGTGKSSLYRALGLLAATAQGQLIPTLAHSGGLPNVLWAGPETISGAMKRGEVPVQGTGSRKGPISLALGFSADDFGYLIDLGLPPRDRFTLFERDPLIKREAIFVGETMRPATTLVRRRGMKVEAAEGRSWQSITDQIPPRHSILSELGDPSTTSEIIVVRRRVRTWRFYDSFRTDPTAPARQPHVGTWTPALSPDGSDLAPAIATILESAWADVFTEAVERGFPGAKVNIHAPDSGYFELLFQQPGLLRPLTAAELSDGTLRYLLLATALLSPEPPSLVVINEPESSLHHDLLPGLAQLIKAAGERTQVIVISHAHELIDAVEDDSPDDLTHHELVKPFGETTIADQGLLTRPTWDWGRR